MADMHVSGLAIYPVKSCAGIVCWQATAGARVRSTSGKICCTQNREKSLGEPVEVLA